MFSERIDNGSLDRRGGRGSDKWEFGLVRRMGKFFNERVVV